MSELKNIRFSFLAIAFFICNIAVLPFIFFVNLKITVPCWSFYLLEISFIFLILLAAFPRTAVSSLLKISVVFIVFISACFLLQGFFPFAPENKLLSFIINEETNSFKIIINLVSLVVLHLVSCFLFASELLRGEKEEIANDIKPTLNYQREEQEIKETTQDNTKLTDMSNGKVDLKNNVNSLFDIYLDDYTNEVTEKTQDLGNMENILLSNLKEGVTGAMCLNSKGEELHDPIFHWQGFNKFDLMELFQANDGLSENLDEGGLCQMLFSDNEHWYLIAKYRGNYLLLQTDERGPDCLIKNIFLLVKAIRQYA